MDGVFPLLPLSDTIGAMTNTAVDMAFLAAEGYFLPLVDILVAEGDAVDDRDLGGSVEKVSILASPNGDRSRVGFDRQAHL